MSPGSASVALTRLMIAIPGRFGGVSIPVMEWGCHDITDSLAPWTMPVITADSAVLMPSRRSFSLNWAGLTRARASSADCFWEPIFAC